MKEKPQLSIVIPCYNEADNIPLILQRFAEVKGDVDAELILVNNGSTDSSQAVLDRELKKYTFARTVLVPKNVGYGHGIMFGLGHARADILAFTHADMQCDPYDALRAYQIISRKQHPERFLIKGWRRKRRLVPQILTSGYEFIATILFLRKYVEINAQPKVFHRSLLSALKFPPTTTLLDFYLLYKANKRKVKIVSIRVDFPERQHGTSKVLFSPFSKIGIIRSFFMYLVRLRFFGEKKALR